MNQRTNGISNGTNVFFLPTLGAKKEPMHIFDFLLCHYTQMGYKMAQAAALRYERLSKRRKRSFLERNSQNVCV